MYLTQSKTIKATLTKDRKVLPAKLVLVLIFTFLFNTHFTVLKSPKIYCFKVSKNLLQLFF